MSFLLANEKYFIKETSVETAFLCSAPQFLSSILFTVAQFISRDSDRFLKRGGNDRMHAWHEYNFISLANLIVRFIAAISLPFFPRCLA